MNSFRALLPTAVLVFVIFLFAAGVGALVADWMNPRLPCLEIEKRYWQNSPWGLTFDKVSSYYWSSLCRPRVPPLVVSASEGTGEPSFPELLRQGWQIQSDQLMGAHRGLKTFGYMFANRIDPDRLRGMRVLALVNPVYFSFAAQTDAASVRLNAISNLAYVLRIHSLIQKWDEFLLDSFYVSAHEYFEELKKFEQPAMPVPIKPAAEVLPMPDGEFDAKRNMLKERAHAFTSFNSRFQTSEQPSRELFDITVRFVKEHPELPVCVVLLPTNTENLEFFGRDARAIVADLNRMFSEVPDGHGVNLQSLNETPKIFLDPMHLTPLGKLMVLQEVMKTACGRRVFEP
jgi:hypothetical protein